MVFTSSEMYLEVKSKTKRCVILMRKSFKINLELSYLDGHIQNTYCINEITLKKTPSIYTHNAQTNTTDPCVYTPYTDKHLHPAPNIHKIILLMKLHHCQWTLWHSTLWGLKSFNLLLFNLELAQFPVTERGQPRVRRASLLTFSCYFRGW